MLTSLASLLLICKITLHGPALSLSPPSQAYRGYPIFPDTPSSGTHYKSLLWGGLWGLLAYTLLQEEVEFSYIRIFILSYGGGEAVR